MKILLLIGFLMNSASAQVPAVGELRDVSQDEPRYLNRHEMTAYRNLATAVFKSEPITLQDFSYLRSRTRAYARTSVRASEGPKVDAWIQEGRIKPEDLDRTLDMLVDSSAGELMQRQIREQLERTYSHVRCSEARTPDGKDCVLRPPR